MKKVLVIDAQGGGLGKNIIAALVEKKLDIIITAVGTNTLATSQMLKAGAHEAATGENSVVVTSKTADVIVGPIGIVIADSMLGEITPRMATAIGQSNAIKVLIPINQCSNLVVGIKEMGMKEMIAQAVDTISKL